MNGEQTPWAVQVAENAPEVFRAIAYFTRGSHQAPVLYRILGNLQNLGSFFPHLSHQLAQGLVKFLEEYDFN